jgi:putative polyhydroxyalkanoate system protein
MLEIHIHREHQLGLTKARKVALQWAEEAEKKFDMECTIVEGKTSDTVEFTRSGVKGELLVEATQFTLHAKLGFLLGAFSKTIESEIEKNLDALLAKGSAVTSVKQPAKTAESKTAESKTAPAKVAAKKAPLGVNGRSAKK